MKWWLQFFEKYYFRKKIKPKDSGETKSIDDK